MAKIIPFPDRKQRAERQGAPDAPAPVERQSLALWRHWSALQAATEVLGVPFCDDERHIIYTWPARRMWTPQPEGGWRPEWVTVSGVVNPRGYHLLEALALLPLHTKLVLEPPDNIERWHASLREVTESYAFDLETPVGETGEPRHFEVHAPVQGLPRAEAVQLAADGLAQAAFRTKTTPAQSIAEYQQWTDMITSAGRF